MKCPNCASEKGVGTFCHCCGHSESEIDCDCVHCRCARQAAKEAVARIKCLQAANAILVKTCSEVILRIAGGDYRGAVADLEAALAKAEPQEKGPTNEP